MTASKKIMKTCKIAALQLTLLLVLLAAFSFFTVSSGAAVDHAVSGGTSDRIVTALLTVDPLNPEINVGEIVTVTIVLSDIVDLYGIELSMTFDPAVVAVVDADAGKTGVQITPGDCPAPDFVVLNSSDNSAGTIGYAATQLNPTPPCDGGVVGRIAFQGVAEGQSAIHFSEWLLSDMDANSLSANTQDGTIDVVVPKATPDLAQVVSVSGNGDYPTAPGFVTDAAGTWRWTAEYSGDSQNESASSGCGEELVTIQEEGKEVYLPVVVH
jgi:hypothetical protein